MRAWMIIAMGLAAGSAAAGGHGEEEAFDVAEMFVELNDTDGDLGIHATVDGEPWRQLEIYGPGGERLLRLRNTGELRNQGLTELAFESAEPEFAELSPEEFFTRFPEGVYEVAGVGVEGELLESEALFTHVMPAPPEIVAPALGDCDDPAEVVAGPVMVDWDPVTMSHPDIGVVDPGIVIASYEVAATRETGEAFSMFFEVGPGTTEVALPADLVAVGDVWKVEVLAREASGNRTAVEGCFEAVAP